MIRLDLFKCKLKLNVDVFKDLIGILDVIKFVDLKIEIIFILLSGIDLTCVIIKLVCELGELNINGDVIGGCFL